jgi:hypothetical protein
MSCPLLRHFRGPDLLLLFALEDFCLDLGALGGQLDSHCLHEFIVLHRLNLDAFLKAHEG